MILIWAWQLGLLLFIGIHLNSVSTKVRLQVELKWPPKNGSITTLLCRANSAVRPAQMKFKFWILIYIFLQSLFTYRLAIRYIIIWLLYLTLIDSSKFLYPSKARGLIENSTFILKIESPCWWILLAQNMSSNTNIIEACGKFTPKILFILVRYFLNYLNFW